jgi:hypothetical protein
MSGRGVEEVIGLLVTDRVLRRHYREDPQGALQELIDRGVELNERELASLASIDAQEITEFDRPIHHNG